MELEDVAKPVIQETNHPYIDDVNLNGHGQDCGHQVLSNRTYTRLSHVPRLLWLDILVARVERTG